MKSRNLAGAAADCERSGFFCPFGATGASSMSEIALPRHPLVGRARRDLTTRPMKPALPFA